MNETSAKFNMGKVMALKVLRDKSLELQKAMDELGEPSLDDLSLLPQIYDAYLNVFRKRGCPQKATQVYHRKKFLLIVLYLYSPKTLAGGKMRVGLRDRLSELFGLSASTPVSDNCSNVVFQYNHYRDFRRDVEIIYNEITATLGDNLIHSD